VTAEVGGRNSPFEPTGDEVPEDGGVVVVVGAVVTAVAPAAAVAVDPGPDGAGGSTANWEPVTTVTWAPSVVGPRAVIAAPDTERATAWAAAWAAGVRWAKYTTVSDSLPTGGESPTPTVWNPNAWRDWAVVVAWS
jgi:hypothetical protein